VYFGGMPRAGWNRPASDRRLSDLVSVGVLTRVFPPDLVDEVIAGAGRTEQRNRSLPARVMAYFAIGMAMHSEGSYADVLSQLTDGLAWSSGGRRTTVRRRSRRSSGGVDRACYAGACVASGWSNTPRWARWSASRSPTCRMCSAIAWRAAAASPATSAGKKAKW